MTKGTKAILLSGAVFPGAGQIVLRRYKQGIIIMAITVAALAFLVTLAVRSALHIMQEVTTAGGLIDAPALVNLAVKASRQDDIYYKGSLLVIVFCWLFSVLDAFRAGEGQEGPDENKNGEKMT